MNKGHEFIKIINDIIDKKYKSAIIIGEIISNNPLIISAQNLQFDREDFLINEDLLTYSHENIYYKFKLGRKVLINKTSNKYILTCILV